MDKRERKARLKEIIKMIDESLVSIEDTKKFMGETEKKYINCTTMEELVFMLPQIILHEAMFQST